MNHNDIIKRKRLNSLKDVKRYLAAKIYEFENKIISEKDLRCFSYSLNILGNLIKDSNVEIRLQKLEQQQVTSEFDIPKTEKQLAAYREFVKSMNGEENE